MENTWVFSAKKVVYGCSFLMLFFLSVISFLYSSDGYVWSLNSIGGILTVALGGVLLGLCAGSWHIFWKNFRKYAG